MLPVSGADICCGTLRHCGAAAGMDRERLHYLLRRKYAPLSAAMRMAMAPIWLWWHRHRIRRRARRAVHPTVIALAVPDIEGSANIELGGEVVLAPEIYFETRGPGSITVGARTRIGRGVLCISHARVDIGTDVVLGDFALLRDAGDACERGGSTAAGTPPARAIVIGNDVWIGAGSTILPGVRIHDGAVVGANSVVAEDVPAGLVVAGIPARPVRQWLDRHRGPIAASWEA